MEKNMQLNFDLLEKRVNDAIWKTDLEYIRSELRKIKEPTIVSGVGGSSVVSDFCSKVLNKKNEIIAINSEPRDFVYRNLNGFKNVIACSYSGNNYGVQLSFNNNLKHYLLSRKSFYDKDVTYLKYDTSIERERSFISLAATLIPISILLNYYLDGDTQLILETDYGQSFDFDVNCDCFEIFSGIDTSTTAKFLESTFVESGIGILIVHDKYSFCHGRSTTSINYNNIAIYLNMGTELDKLLMDELKKYYKEFVVLNGIFLGSILGDYRMLVNAMYLTKYIAEQKQKDLSGVDYSDITEKIYKFNGKL